MDQKTLFLNVIALQGLVIGMFGAMLKRDPNLDRELVMDEGVTNVANLPGLARFSAKAKQALQGILDSIPPPHSHDAWRGPTLH